MSFRIAVHLCGWPQEARANNEDIFRIARDAGYDGVEGISVTSAEELLEAASLAASYGLHLVNVGSKDPEMKAKVNATLGNTAAEVPAGRKARGSVPSAAELEALCEPIRPVISLFERYGLKPFHHIHIGTLLETTEDCAQVLGCLPDLRLLFDTGHLLAAKSNPMDVLSRFPDQIAHVHLKNFWTQDPAGGWDHCRADFWKTSRFCDLREGNVGLDVGAVLQGLEKTGYDGWISIEEDHPARDIVDVVTDNRAFLKSLGY